MQKLYTLFLMIVVVMIILPLTSYALMPKQKGLHHAVQTDNINLINTILTNVSVEDKKKIIDSKDDKGCPPLWHAARNGNVTIIKLLLAHGANINEANINEITPLMIAATQAHVQAVQTLLEAGADVTIKSRYGAAIQEVVQSLAVILKRAPENEERLVNYAKILMLLKQHDVLQKQLMVLKKQLARLRYALVVLRRQVIELQNMLGD